MSSERKPTSEYSLFAAPIVAITRYCVRYPVAIVALSVVFAVAGAYSAATQLGFEANRLDPIHSNGGADRPWLEYLGEFGEANDVIVVVEGETGASVAPVLDELSDEILSHESLFLSALHGIDISKIRAKGLHYVPVESLEKVAAFTKNAVHVTKDRWALLNIGNFLQTIRMRLEHPEEAMRHGETDSGDAARAPNRQMTLYELDLLASSLSRAFAPQPIYVSPWPQVIGFPGTPASGTVGTYDRTDIGYFIVPEARDADAIGFVMVRIADSRRSFAGDADAIEKLREFLDAARKKYPNLEIGLTGLPIVENDEMRLSRETTGRASIFAFCGVVVVFFVGLGGFRHPISAIVALVTGLGWTAGYILVSVGHVNILSSALSVILIGFGAHFSIRYIARYLLLRQEIRSPAEAIIQTSRIMGPGILTGAMTTAIAFFAVGFTDSTDLAELGIIGGGGIMLGCFVTLLLVPALLQVVDGSRPMRKVSGPVDAVGWLKPFHDYPKTTLCFGLVFTLFLMTGWDRVWYDHDLTNLRSEGLESVEWEEKLLAGGGPNRWHALSMADDEDELLYRKALWAEKYPELRVEEIVSLIPRNDARKIPIIRDIAATLADVPENPPVIPLSRPDDVAQTIAQVQTLLETPLGDDALIRQISQNLSQVRQSLRTLSEADCFRRMQDYQNAIADDLLSRLHALKETADPQPPELSDLPEPFVSGFVGKNGRHLMKIHADADTGNMEDMREFVRKVRDVDPEATGAPLQIYDASLRMRQDCRQAALYAMVAIMIPIWLNVRSLGDTIRATVPMFAGTAQTLGTMGLLDIPLNPVNAIAIPLICGIGADYGVRVVHDFRRQTGRYRLSPSTAGAMVMTSLTTLIGFGSLMIVSHRGLQSLARVLVVGMSCGLFCAMIFLPAFLTWWTRSGRAESKRDSSAAIPLQNEILKKEFLRKKTFQESGLGNGNLCDPIYIEVVESPYREHSGSVDVSPLFSASGEPPRREGDAGFPEKAKRLRRRDTAYVETD